MDMKFRLRRLLLIMVALIVLGVVAFGFISAKVAVPECVSEYILSDPHIIANSILQNNGISPASDYDSVWYMKDGRLQLLIRNNGKTAGFDVCHSDLLTATFEPVSVP